VLNIVFYLFTEGPQVSHGAIICILSFTLRIRYMFSTNICYEGQCIFGMCVIQWKEIVRFAVSYEAAIWPILEKDFGFFVGYLIVKDVSYSAIVRVN
jgi:hypothetical protein